VQNTEDTNFLILRVRERLLESVQSSRFDMRATVIDSRRTAREEGSICTIPSVKFIEKDWVSPTISFLDVVACGSLVVRADDSRNLEHLHRPIKHTMNDLKARRLVAPYGRSMANVARLTFALQVLEDDVTRLE
jgi:hypothetical protein